MIHDKLKVMCVASALMVAACDQSEPETPAATEPAMAKTAAPESLAERLASDARSVEDRARDAGRKPVEVLAFVGIEPSMHVIDLMAAGGWYSEVLAHAVGADGSVTAQNPPWMLAFRDGYYDNALAQRIGDRLTNVTKLDASWAELAAMGRRYDAALSALNFHDVYYLQSPESAAEMMATVYAILKPGGVFGLIDHVGNPDGENNTLHRIDKAIVLEVATAAGFVVEGDSDLLANPADDHTQGVFSEGIRGQTDRFLLKLKRPAE